MTLTNLFLLFRNLIVLVLYREENRKEKGRYPNYPREMPELCGERVREKNKKRKTKIEKQKKKQTKIQHNNAVYTYILLANTITLVNIEGKKIKNQTTEIEEEMKEAKEKENKTMDIV